MKSLISSFIDCLNCLGERTRAVKCRFGSWFHDGGCTPVEGLVTVGLGGMTMSAHQRSDLRAGRKKAKGAVSKVVEEPLEGLSAFVASGGIVCASELLHIAAEARTKCLQSFCNRFNKAQDKFRNRCPAVRRLGSQNATDKYAPQSLLKLAAITKSTKRSRP